MLRASYFIMQFTSFCVKMVPCHQQFLEALNFCQCILGFDAGRDFTPSRRSRHLLLPRSEVSPAMLIRPVRGVAQELAAMDAAIQFCARTFCIVGV